MKETKSIKELIEIEKSHRDFFNKISNLNHEENFKQSILKADAFLEKAENKIARVASKLETASAKQRFDRIMKMQLDIFKKQRDKGDFYFETEDLLGVFNVVACAKEEKLSEENVFDVIKYVYEKWDLGRYGGFILGSAQELYKENNEEKEMNA